MIGRKRMSEFEKRLLQLEAQQSHVRWWNVVGGIAATIAAILGLITLLNLLVK